jgi:hypothetical protein
VTHSKMIPSMMRLSQDSRAVHVKIKRWKMTPEQMISFVNELCEAGLIPIFPLHMDGAPIVRRETL